VDDRIEGSFTRLLTATLAFEIESGWIHRNWGPSQRSGFDMTTLGLKGLLYKNELHEVMISAGLAWVEGSAEACSCYRADMFGSAIWTDKTGHVMVRTLGRGKPSDFRRRSRLCHEF
jgi:hypothetical protein